MNPQILKLLVMPDGTVEAFYTFTDAQGLPQNAATVVVADASGLLATALQAVTDQLTALAPSASGPAELVAAMTQLGNVKKQVADLQKQADALQAQVAAATPAGPVTG